MPLVYWSIFTSQSSDFKVIFHHCKCSQQRVNFYRCHCP
jgi:hypothetical protein